MNRSTAVSWLAGGLLIAACGRSQPPEIAPHELVQQAAASMQQLDGFHFLIDRQGASAFIDPQQSLSFRRAEGDFVAPDSTQAEVRIIGPGIVLDVQVISIGDQQWESNPLSGEWQEVPAGAGFNPADLLDPNRGLQQLLVQELTDPQLVGTSELEELPGKQLYQLQSGLQGTTLAELSFGLIDDPQPSIQLWIEPDSYYLHRIEIQEYAGDAERQRSWTIDFWDFGQVQQIEPPIP